MKRLFILVSLFLLGTLGASAQTATVTGTAKFPSGGSPTNVKACFVLVDYQPAVPRVVGSYVLVQQRNFCVTADASGDISTNLVRNDQITPSGTTWRVDWMWNGQLQSSARFNVNSATFDLDTATPVTTDPVVTAPTGDSTYQRVDGGNQATGNYVPNATGLDLGATGARWDAFLQALNISGSITGGLTPAASGSQAIGTSSFPWDAVLDDVTASKVNSIIFVCSTCTYTTINAAVTAAEALANGGEVWTAPGYTETITAAITLGTTAKPVTLRLARDSVITVNVTGGGCAVQVANASSIIGEGTIGGNGTNDGGAIFDVASTANVSAVICNADVTGAQEYFNVSGILINDHASATVSGALIDLQAVFVPSSLKDIVVVAAGHTGLRFRNAGSSVGFGPFRCDNCWLNGGTTAGSKPLVIESVASGGLMAGIVFTGGAIEHAGTGEYEAVIDGDATASSILGVHFVGTYCEHSYANVGCLSIRDAQNVTITGMTAAGVAGADVINISQSAGSRTFGIIVAGLRDQVGFTNLINDTIHTTTIASAANSGTLPFYELGSTDLTTAGFRIYDKLQADSLALIGKATTYNNIATVSNGVPSEYATVDLTAQTAAIGTTTLYAVPASGVGQYRVSWNAKVTTPATTGAATSTLGALTIVYTDPDGVVQTITAPASVAAGTIATTSTGNSTTTVLIGMPLTLNCKASTNITYAMAYASDTANQMAYNLHIKLEAL